MYNGNDAVNWIVTEFLFYFFPFLFGSVCCRQPTVYVCVCCVQYQHQLLILSNKILVYIVGIGLIFINRAHPMHTFRQCETDTEHRTFKMFPSSIHQIPIGISNGWLDWGWVVGGSVYCHQIQCDYMFFAFSLSNNNNNQCLSVSVYSNR